MVNTRYLLITFLLHQIFSENFTYIKMHADYSHSLPSLTSPQPLSTPSLPYKYLSHVLVCFVL